MISAIRELTASNGEGDRKTDTQSKIMSANPVRSVCSLLWELKRHMQQSEQSWKEGILVSRPEGQRRGCKGI